MRYMLLICANSTEGPLDAGPEVDASGWAEEMDRRGIRSIGQRLAPPVDATTVRVRDGKVLLTDGPFVETKEIICGFDLIECGDLDEAIDVARKHPMATHGMIEVRPFWMQPPPS